MNDTQQRETVQNTKDILSLDESTREIAALEELYSDLIKKKPKDAVQEQSYKEQAKFARERILRLSLHVRNILERMGQ